MSDCGFFLFVALVLIALRCAAGEDWSDSWYDIFTYKNFGWFDDIFRLGRFVFLCVVLCVGAGIFGIFASVGSFLANPGARVASVAHASQKQPVVTRTAHKKKPVSKKAKKSQIKRTLA